MRQERAALEYADRMTITGQDVDDELFARLRRFFDEDALVELTAAIAWENSSSKFNRALRIPSQGLGSDPEAQEDLACAETSRRCTTSSPRPPTRRSWRRRCRFVRKLSGFTRPSRAERAAFARAVEEVAQAARTLLAGLVTNAPPRDREDEAAKARREGGGRRF